MPAAADDGKPVEDKIKERPSGHLCSPKQGAAPVARGRAAGFRRTEGCQHAFFAVLAAACYAVLWCCGTVVPVL